MSVPLDRLYNFLRDSSDHDIIIYRYCPHGSKNPANLNPLDDVNVVHKVCLLHMLCHDQEPLDCAESFFGDSRLLRQMIHCGENFWPKCLVLHSELNSNHVKAISNVAEPVYYWSHALIARDWFRYAQKDPSLTAKDIKQTFLIYNRAWSGTREYRLHVANQLVTHDLVRHCLTAFNPIDSVHFSQHQFVNEKFRPNHNLEQHFVLNTHPSWASADYNCADYRHTKIEVVLETLFDDSRIHLTEKTLRPIACGQPFLLASTPGSLKYLQSYGFETFDPVISEHYDQIVDPVDRITAVVEQMQRLITHDRPTWLQNELMARCRHNQKRFFSDEFFQTVVNEYKQNLDLAVQRATSTINCTYIHKFLQHSKWQHKYTKQDAKEIWLRYHALTKTR